MIVWNARGRDITAESRFKIAPESLILALFCLLDLATTLFWIARHGASEGNPLMAYFLERNGAVGFALAKCATFIPPLMIAEWARRTHPRFVHAALRCGIVGYLALYGLGVKHVNHSALADAERINAACAQAPRPFEIAMLRRHARVADSSAAVFAQSAALMDR